MIGDRLKKYMEETGINIPELARRTGIATGSLSAIRNNKRDPSSDTIERILRVTDLDAQWLLTGDGPMMRYPAKPGTATGVREDPALYHSGGSNEFSEILDKVAAIMRSEDKGTRAALQQNIEMFYQKIEESRRLRELEEEVVTLKKALGYGTLPGNTNQAGKET